MPRNGHSATTAKTREPKDYYDTLAQDVKDAWDYITSQSFVITKTDDGFVANSDVHAKSFTHENVRGLSVEVRKFIVSLPPKEDPVINVDKLPRNGNGNGRAKQPRLPGTGDIPELDAQADVCIDAQDAKQEATANDKNQRLAMGELMKKHGRISYARAGFTITLKEKEVVEIKQEKNRKQSEADGVVDPLD